MDQTEFPPVDLGQSSPIDSMEESDFMSSIMCPVCEQVQCECTDEELAAAANMLRQQEPTVQEAVDESSGEGSDVPTVYDLIKRLPDCPSEDQIEAWKQRHKSVFSMVFAEDDIYLFRSCTRAEWDKIQNHPGAQVQDPMKANKFITYQVVDTCLLWPKLAPKDWEHKQAGLQDALSNALMVHSYFLNQAQALSLVTRM